MAITYFTDRIVEHPGRVQMTPVSGQTDVYDVDRDEGTITEAGTPFNAATFNQIANDIILRSKTYYGICSSGASSQIKTVDADDFVLRKGVIIAVCMWYRNTYSGTIQLNVSDTGPIDVQVLDGSYTAQNQNITWEVNSTVLFVYDGDAWNLISGARIAPTRVAGIIGSAPSSGNCAGWYDPMTGAVRLTFGFTATANVGIDDVLFTIPSGYRPKEALTGVCVIGTAAGTLGSGGVLVGTDGTIKQRITSQARSGYGSIEYYI